MENESVDGINSLGPTRTRILPLDYRAEPTEVIPNGLAGSEAIQISSESSSVLRPAAETFTPEQLMRAAGRSPEEIGNEEERSAGVVGEVYKRYEIGTKTRLHLRLFVAKGSYLDGTIEVSNFDRARSYAKSEIPNDLRARLESAIAAAIQARDSRNGSRPPE